jgi:outer membrane protein assembly factor BamD
MFRSFFILLFGCLLLSGHNFAYAKSSMPSSERPMEQAENAYQNTGFKDLLTELEGKAPADIFKRAKKAQRDKEYTTAIQTYRALNSLYPFSEYAEGAWLEMIRAYYDNSEMDDVIKVANKFLRLYPISETLEEVSYLRAKAYFYRRDKILTCINNLFGYAKIDFAERVNIDQLNEAAHQFNAFLQRFPTGVYREKVQTKLNELHQLIARKEYLIADFDFKKKMYVGCYNRIVELLERYPRVHDMLGKKDAAILDRAYRQCKQQLGLIS